MGALTSQVEIRGSLFIYTLCMPRTCVLTDIVTKQPWVEIPKLLNGNHIAYINKNALNNLCCKMIEIKANIVLDYRIENSLVEYLIIPHVNFINRSFPINCPCLKSLEIGYFNESFIEKYSNIQIMINKYDKKFNIREVLEKSTTKRRFVFNYYNMRNQFLLQNEPTKIDYYNGNKDKVRIREGFVTIGINSFSKSNINLVSIPSSLKIICEKAFYECTNLSTVIFCLGSQLEEIGAYAFDLTNILHMKLPEKLKKIGVKIVDCEKLNLEFTQIEEIPDGAFESTRLNVINFTNSLKFIGKYSFKQCKNIASVDLKRCTKIKEIAYQTFKNCENLRTIIFPPFCEVIRFDAFSFCSQLRTLNLPQSMRLIEDYAFYMCNEFHDFQLPSMDIIIRKQAFHGKFNIYGQYINETIYEKEERLRAIKHRFDKSIKILPKYYYYA